MITINGKAYKASEKAEWYINDLIKYGDLEEWRDNVFKSDEVPFGEQSILEKLREWEQEERNDALSPLVMDLLDRLSVFITSLETPPEEFDTKQERISYRDLCSNTETKEEPTHKGEHQNDVCSKVTPQFTPGQEIEVSDDGIDWVQGRFVSMYGSKYRVDNTSEDFPSMRTYWYNARPIEDKIELLPAYEPSEPDWRDTQISLLTRTVNQLISK